MLSQQELERYQQQIHLCELGINGQEILKESSVVVIGAGGLGCVVLQYLTAAGVGKVGVVDGDCIEASNLHRQLLFDSNDIGKRKSDVAAQKLREMNPHVNLVPIAVYLSNENASRIINEYDLIIDASDNFLTRYAIDHACSLSKKPWIYGSVTRFQGQAAVFEPPNSHYHHLFPNQNLEAENCSTRGVLGPMPGIIGSIQALEAIKFLAGLEPSLKNRLLVFDASSMESRVYFLNNDIDRVSITQEDLKTMAKDVQLVDMRNEDDFMNVLLPYTADKLYVLFCHKGIRSLHAARYLRQKFKATNIYSLQGGPPSGLKA